MLAADALEDTLKQSTSFVVNLDSPAAPSGLNLQDAFKQYRDGKLVSLFLLLYYSGAIFT